MANLYSNQFPKRNSFFFYFSSSLTNFIDAVIALVIFTVFEIYCSRAFSLRLDCPWSLSTFICGIHLVFRMWHAYFTLWLRLSAAALSTDSKRHKKIKKNTSHYVPLVIVMNTWKRVVILPLVAAFSFLIFFVCSILWFVICVDESHPVCLVASKHSKSIASCDSNTHMMII